MINKETIHFYLQCSWRNVHTHHFQNCVNRSDRYCTWLVWIKLIKRAFQCFHLTIIKYKIDFLHKYFGIKLNAMKFYKPLDIWSLKSLTCSSSNPHVSTSGTEHAEDLRDDPWLSISWDFSWIVLSQWNLLSIKKID